MDGEKIFVVFDQVALGEAEASGGTTHPGHAIVDMEVPVVERSRLDTLSTLKQQLIVVVGNGEIEERVDNINV